MLDARAVERHVAAHLVVAVHQVVAVGAAEVDDRVAVAAEPAHLAPARLAVLDEGLQVRVGMPVAQPVDACARRRDLDGAVELAEHEARGGAVAARRAARQRGVRPVDSATTTSYGFVPSTFS